MVLTGIFSYFSSSVRNVGKSEDDLQSIKEIQRLVNDLRHDLIHVKPYLNRESKPIDGYPQIERQYEYRLKQFGFGVKEGKFLPIEPTIVKFEKQAQPEGTVFWRKLRILDKAFDRPVNFQSEANIFENSAAVIERELSPPEPFASSTSDKKFKDKIKVTELYIFSNAEKILYRYYPEPFSFIRKVKFDSDGAENPAYDYGLDLKTLEGRIQSFAATPVFDHLMFQSAVNNAYELHFHKFFFSVNFSVKGTTNRGPQAKFYTVNFNVSNSQLNGNKYHRGIFK